MAGNATAANTRAIDSTPNAAAINAASSASAIALR